LFIAWIAGLRLCEDAPIRLGALALSGYCTGSVGFVRPLPEPRTFQAVVPAKAGIQGFIAAWL